MMSQTLKYLDCFGTNFNFYTEKKRKFYTPFGGFLTVLSTIVGFMIFIYINIDDFYHNSQFQQLRQLEKIIEILNLLKKKYGYLGE